MKQKVYKYPLEKLGYQKIAMPKGAEIMTAQLQHGKIYLWSLVNPEVPQEDHEFMVIGTGEPFPENVDFDKLAFIDTVQEVGGALVWHVFLITD